MQDIHYLRCKRCNRLLKTESAQIRGYGASCWKKVDSETNKKNRDLLNRKIVIKEDNNH